MIEHKRRHTIYKTDLVVLETQSFICIAEVEPDVKVKFNINKIRIIDKFKVKRESQRQNLIYKAIKSDFFNCDF